MKSRAIMSGLLGKELIIHSEQVLSITLDKMIVEDSVGRAREKRVSTVST